MLEAVAAKMATWPHQQSTINNHQSTYQIIRLTSSTFAVASPDF
jgi:hypothetical protein